jgi:serine/threonine-protein kinase RsbW
MDMSSTDPDRTFSLVIGNAIAEMQKVVDLVDCFGAHHALPQRVINDLNVCLDELINNTISYGYEDRDAHSIAIKLSLDADVLSAEIRDDGKPFDPRQAAPAVLDESLQSRQIGGLGLHFVKSLMDEISYTRVGHNNVVKISKRLRQ